LDFGPIRDFREMRGTEPPAHLGFRGVFGNSPPTEERWRDIEIDDIDLKGNRKVVFLGPYFGQRSYEQHMPCNSDRHSRMGLTFQAQIMDSRTNEVLASSIALRGKNGPRVEFAEFDQDVRSFSARRLCRLIIPGGRKIRISLAAGRRLIMRRNIMATLPGSHP
jgi:hypothetical protein